MSKAIGKFIFLNDRKDASYQTGAHDDFEVLEVEIGPDSSVGIKAGGGRYHVNHSCWLYKPYNKEADADAGRSGSGVGLTSEWNGEGLPPVGCECEVEWSEAKFIPCKILYIGVSVVLVRLERSEECYTLSAVKFRPIRSEEDRKRLEVAEALIRFLDSETDIDNAFYVGDVIGFFDYIAAGKIPGIRIE